MVPPVQTIVFPVIDKTGAGFTFKVKVTCVKQELVKVLVTVKIVVAAAEIV